MSPRLAAENPAGDPATVPWAFWRHWVWSCVAGDDLRAALGPHLPAPAAAQGEDAARGGAPGNPGALGFRVAPNTGLLALHTLPFLETLLLFTSYLFIVENMDVYKGRVSLLRVVCC